MSAGRRFRTHHHRLAAQRTERFHPRRAGGERLRHGARVVAVVTATATTVEVLGHGVYEDGTASPETVRRLAIAIEAADLLGAGTEIDPAVFTQAMSAARAEEFQASFRRRDAARRARPAMQRAEELATRVRSGHRVRLDSGRTIGLESCWVVPVEEFEAYAEGCTVVTATH